MILFVAATYSIGLFVLVDRYDRHQGSPRHLMALPGEAIQRVAAVHQPPTLERIAKSRLSTRITFNLSAVMLIIIGWLPVAAILVAVW